jgi:hypothetical protein
MVTRVPALLAGIGLLLVGPVSPAQTAPPTAAATKTNTADHAKTAAARRSQARVANNGSLHSPYTRTRETEKAREYYPSAWGVQRLQTQLTSSGNLVRFTFRVLDPARAKPFADHAATPYLYAPRTHAMLQVPTMEKIGQLRQLGNLEPNKDYWMVFSNKGNLVRAGDRVNVIIGPFHAEGLLVE